MAAVSRPFRPYPFLLGSSSSSSASPCRKARPFLYLTEAQKPLDQKIKKLYCRVYALQEVPASPELIELTQQKQALENCLRVWREGRADLASLFLRILPAPLKNEIYFTVWLAHGAPTQDRYGELAIERDIGALFAIQSAFVFPKGENIVEQFLHLWREKEALEKNRLALKQLRHLLVLCKEPYVSRDSLKTLFEKLPLSLQWEMHGAVYRLSPDKQEEAEWGKKALERDIFLLKKLKVIDYLLESYSNQQIPLLQEERERQKACFDLLLSDPAVSKKSLKICYKRLSPALRAELPSPPYFGRGVHYTLYKTLGAHPNERGTHFRLFAPAAKEVSIAIKYDTHDQRILPLRKTRGGVWEVYAEGVREGTTYEYILTPQEGSAFRKIDPFAFGSRAYSTPCFHHESLVAATGAYRWGDSRWMEKRKNNAHIDSPVNIYQLHPTSWKKVQGRAPTYRELAPLLIDYCKEMHYTHVQLMGILEHPEEASWGYQVTGFFSPNHRLGSPEDFQFLVDRLHQNEIGVILDWSGAHFATDFFGLHQFDGSYLYESPDPLKRQHPRWGSYIFNYEKREVREFLLSSLFYWLDKMHIDGIRFDAVSSMIYLDYDRKNPEQFRNKKGGNLNFSALSLLRDANALIHEHFPGVLTIAEESSGHPHLTKPLQKKEKGLGFDLKVGFNWMHHSFKHLFEERSHERLLNSIHGDGSEAVLLSLSHDEVSHGKRSLLNKNITLEDRWQKFAHLRLLFGYMLSLPGNKLSFMGNEIAQSEEWSDRMRKGWEVGWHELSHPLHQGVKRCVQALNRLYRSHPALWGRENSASHFTWIDNRDTLNSTCSYLRSAPSGQALICVHNFSTRYIENYTLSFPHDTPSLKRLSCLKEIFNSDHTDFGGTGKSNPQVEILRSSTGEATGFKIRLAPLATMLFEKI